MNFLRFLLEPILIFLSRSLTSETLIWNYNSLSILAAEYLHLPYHNHRGYDHQDHGDNGGESDDEDLSLGEDWLVVLLVGEVVEREIVVGVTRVVEIADVVVCRLRFIITWQLSVFTSAPNSHVAIGLFIPATRTEDKTRQESPAHLSPQGQPQY